MGSHDREPARVSIFCSDSPEAPAAPRLSMWPLHLVWQLMILIIGLPCSDCQNTRPLPSFPTTLLHTPFPRPQPLHVENDRKFPTENSRPILR